MTISNTELRPLTDKEKTELRELTLAATKNTNAYLTLLRDFPATILRLLDENDDKDTKNRVLVREENILVQENRKLASRNAALVKDCEAGGQHVYELTEQVAALVKERETLVAVIDSVMGQGWGARLAAEAASKS